VPRQRPPEVQANDMEAAAFRLAWSLGLPVTQGVGLLALLPLRCHRHHRRPAHAQGTQGQQGSTQPRHRRANAPACHGEGGGTGAPLGQRPPLSLASYKDTCSA
jgi:hypothetical protein